MLCFAGSGCVTMLVVGFFVVPCFGGSFEEFRVPTGASSKCWFT
jgi:hypothetical protein